MLSSSRANGDLTTFDYLCKYIVMSNNSQREAISRTGKKEITVASYHAKRYQLVEEVPGLCIRRLTLEDPKTARQRANSGLQFPAHHVCHPRANYVPLEPPTSRSWFNQIRCNRQAVLKIISLQLPECPVPLIDSQTHKRCKTANIRNNMKDETLKQIFSKFAEAKAKNIINLERKQKSEVQNTDFINQTYENGHCCQDIQNFEGSFIRAPTLDDSNDVDNGGEADNDVNREDDGANEKTVNKKLVIRTEAASTDCMCAQISEKLRISIRKKTKVADSCNQSPELTHMICIAMKYHGRRNLVKSSNNDEETLTPTRSSCSGVSVALDFTLNCNSMQLSSRDVTARPIEKNVYSARTYPTCSLR